MIDIIRELAYAMASGLGRPFNKAVASPSDADLLAQ